jgi:hypothetical protein
MIPGGGERRLYKVHKTIPDTPTLPEMHVAAESKLKLLRRVKSYH